MIKSIENLILKCIYMNSKRAKEIKKLGNIACDEWCEKLQEKVKLGFFYDDSIDNVKALADSLLHDLDDSDVRDLKINVWGLFKSYDDDKRIRKLTREEAIVNSYVILYHEIAHFEQLYEEKNGTASDDIALSMYVALDRAFYMRNYKRFHHEIDADIRAIRKAYKQLLCDYPEIDSMPYIKHYMYDRYNQDSDLKGICNKISECNQVGDLIDILKSIDDRYAGIRPYIDNLYGESYVRIVMDKLADNCDIYTADNTPIHTGNKAVIVCKNVYFDACTNREESFLFVASAIHSASPQYRDRMHKNYHKLFEGLNLDYFHDVARKRKLEKLKQDNILYN